MKTNWQPIVKAVLAAKPPRDKLKYSLSMIEAKTKINIYTLSRLSTQPGRTLDYDSGLSLMSMYNELKKINKIK